MTNATVHFEAGVSYFRISYPSIESKPWPATKVSYETIHVPSGRRYPRHVFLDRPKTDLPRLLAHWNSPHPELWRYE